MHTIPAQVSANGRYFLDADGQPCFWLGDTQWNLFRCHTLDEARIILESRAALGMNVIQVMLHGFPSAPAVQGEAFPNNDPLAPDPVYFAHVDAVVRLARGLGLALAVGVDHPSFKLANRENARTYGRWLGERYREFDNILWVASYYVPAGGLLEITRELALGLREGDGGTHLITCHPDPALPVATSGIAHTEEWLDFNCIQTFKSIELICASVSADYARTPAKPVVLAEGAYEAGPEYGIAITPRRVRQQAYLSYLAGGHHSYGHNDNWRVLPTWRESLSAPGARQMAVLRGILTALPWWELLPDQAVFADAADAENPFLRAARTPAGGLWLLYTSEPQPLTLRTDLLPAWPLRAEWIDPRGGARQPAAYEGKGDVCVFTCPEGWEDALLLLSAERASA